MDLRGQYSTTDRSLGDSVVYRGDRRMILSTVPFFVATLALFGWPSPWRLAGWSAIATPMFYVALSAWRTELVVGRLGFRFTRPLHRDREAMWIAVQSLELEARGRYKQILVSSEFGHPTVVRISGLRSRLQDVCAAAQESWGYPSTTHEGTVEWAPFGRRCQP